MGDARGRNRIEKHLYEFLMNSNVLFYAMNGASGAGACWPVQSASGCHFCAPGSGPYS